MMTLAFLQNMGMWEWIVILIVVLLIFGSRLPGLGRSLGRSVNEFKTGLKEGQEEGAAEAKTTPPAEAAKKD
ncbi:MAG: hypothetical protein AMXMBFR7_43830 [Planctomycetota bacterium]